MQQRLIIFTVVLFLLISSVYLSQNEAAQQNISGRNIWTLYFENPSSTSMDATIENHTSSEQFLWEIYVDKEKVRNGESIVTKGQTKTLPVAVSDIQNKRITISVSHEGEKREIYKNF